MPFEPKNTPVFYTTMMKIINDELVIIFTSTKYCVPCDTCITKTFCDSKTIIDYTLIYSNLIPILYQYFSCVSQVFTKYWLVSLADVVSSCLASNMSDMILQQTVIVLPSPNLISLNNILSHHMCLFSLLLYVVHSTTVIFNGLNQTSKFFVVYSVCFYPQLTSRRGPIHTRENI